MRITSWKLVNKLNMDQLERKPGPPSGRNLESQSAGFVLFTLYSYAIGLNLAVWLHKSVEMSYLTVASLIFFVRTAYLAIRLRSASLVLHVLFALALVISLIRDLRGGNDPSFISWALFGVVVTLAVRRLWKQ